MLTMLHSWLPVNYIPDLTHAKQIPLPLIGIQNLDDLAKTLISLSLDEWIMRKEEIRAFIQQHSTDLQQLNCFFSTLNEWGIERDSEKSLAFFIDIVSVDLLSQVICFREKNSPIPFKNLFEWATERAPLFPDPSSTQSSLKSSLYCEWKKCRPLTLDFISNIINLFLRGFTFFDPRKYGATIWETSLAIGIAYKLLTIPYEIIKHFQSLHSISAKVYVIAAFIIVAIGYLISFYQHWLKPIPNEIINCTNLDKQIEMEHIEPKVGQAKELEKLIAALSVGSNVLLLGPSGEGKTALFQHLIQLKRDGKLPQELQQLHAFLVDCGSVISNASHGHSELINQMKDQIEHCSKNILFVFDEFYQVATNKGAFLAFKKRFFEDQPQTKLIATMTLKEFEELKKLDVDGSFQRRIVPIVIESSSENQNRLILQERIHRLAKEIPITEDAIEAILKYSQAQDYLPGIGRPSKVIKLLTDAIGVCKQTYHSEYIPLELQEAYQKYEELRLQAMHEIIVKPKTWKNIQNCQSKIQSLEQDLKRHQTEIKNIQKILKEQQRFQEDYYRLNHLFAKTKDVISQKAISEKEQITYLWYSFYAFDAIKKILQSKIEKMPPSIPVQIDAALIDRVYQESVKMGKDLKNDQVVHHLPVHG